MRNLKASKTKTSIPLGGTCEMVHEYPLSTNPPGGSEMGH